MRRRKIFHAEFVEFFFYGAAHSTASAQKKNVPVYLATAVFYCRNVQKVYSHKLFGKEQVLGIGYFEIESGTLFIKDILSFPKLVYYRRNLRIFVKIAVKRIETKRFGGLHERVLLSVDVFAVVFYQTVGYFRRGRHRVEFVE